MPVKLVSQLLDLPIVPSSHFLSRTVCALSGFETPCIFLAFHLSQLSFLASSSAPKFGVFNMRIFSIL